MQDIDLGAITTDRIRHPRFAPPGIEMEMLRLDKIHPSISGNKWFKLRFYLEEALRLGKKRVITFGGPWSNHLLATAAACRQIRIECTGVVRGEKPAVFSDTLQKAAGMGMHLEFLDRRAFRANKHPSAWLDDENYFIPQGGYGLPGVNGAATITEYMDPLGNYTHILCAVGTGTMLAGLVRSARPGQRITGISVMKNNMQLEDDIRRLLMPSDIPFQLLHDYHFGGYAKCNQELLRFMNDWYSHTGIPTDFVYTGKLCYAATDLSQQNFFPAGSRVLLIHSGGLTGNVSLKKGTLIF